MPASLITRYKPQLLLQHVQVISEAPEEHNEVCISISVSLIISSSTAYRSIDQLTELYITVPESELICEMNTCSFGSYIRCQTQPQHALCITTHLYYA